MRSSNKSRSRSKGSSRNRSMGNVVNRVFDSAGPEGKVRGTPQQIIEKYTALARDAQLSGDRVAAENFQQHAEHYLRMLEEAQREQAERQAEHQRQQDQQQARRGDSQQDDSGGNGKDASADGFGVARRDDSSGDDSGSGLVETPESAASSEQEKPARTRTRRPRTTSKTKTDEAQDAGSKTAETPIQ